MFTTVSIREPRLCGKKVISTSDLNKVIVTPSIRCEFISLYIKKKGNKNGCDNKSGKEVIGTKNTKKGNYYTGKALID